MRLSPRVRIMEPEQATAVVSNAAHHHEFSDLAAVAQHDSVGSATASIRPGRGQGRLQAAVRGHWQRWPGAQKYGDHLSITPVMRRAAVPCSSFYFVERTQGNLVLAADCCRGVCMLWPHWIDTQAWQVD